MTIQQVSVFLGNEPGRLAAVAAVLKNSGINIRALMVAETEKYGVLRMIVNRPDDAGDALKKAGFTVRLNPMIAAAIDDREGVFHDIMKLCDAEGINVEYTYSFVEQASNKAILFLRFEDTEGAARMFLNSGYKLLSADEVCKI